MTQLKTYDKKAEAKAQKEIIARLAELGGKQANDDDIAFEGDRLIIPASMDLPRAIKFLEKKREEDEEETVFTRTFNYRPWDGAYCTFRALKRVFGTVSQEKMTIQTLFGSKKVPSNLITINTDVGKQEQVPWGAFELPALPGVVFQASAVRHAEYGTLYVLNATGAKRWASPINGIYRIIEDELQTNSMYRGKAFDGQEMPEFIDLSAVNRAAVVYSQDVMTQLEVNVWAQLRHTDTFARRGIPLKRAVLVHGPYGTGKTLAAMLTAQEAVANGWTFVKARPGRDDLSTVMQTARLYQPAVVFYEDVDTITDAQDNDQYAISRLLDDFDGIDAKGSRLLCVLTTNHVDRIHKAMARPGRLDAMIEINALDLEGVTELVKVKVGDLIADEVDWEAVYKAADQYVPAFVTEFADNAIRYAVTRNAGDDEGIRIETEDLVLAAQGLRPQFKHMDEAKDRVQKPVLDSALKDIVAKTIRDHIYEDYLVAEEDVARG